MSPGSLISPSSLLVIALVLLLWTAESAASHHSAVATCVTAPFIVKFGFMPVLTELFCAGDVSDPHRTSRRRCMLGAVGDASISIACESGLDSVIVRESGIVVARVYVN